MFLIDIILYIKVFYESVTSLLQNMSVIKILTCVTTAERGKVIVISNHGLFVLKIICVN